MTRIMDRAQALQLLHQPLGDGLKPLGDESLPWVESTHMHHCEAWCSRTLPPHTLMRRAGCGCAVWLTPKLDPGAVVHILCGPGNNGGDGLVCAAALASQGVRVSVGLLDKPTTDDANWALQLAMAMHVPIRPIGHKLQAADIYLDALVGRGLCGQLRAPLAQLVEQLNSSGKLLASFDLPSGWGTAGVCAMPEHALLLLALDPQLGARAGNTVRLARLPWQAWFYGLDTSLAGYPHASWLSVV